MENFKQMWKLTPFVIEFIFTSQKNTSNRSKYHLHADSTKTDPYSINSSNLVTPSQ